jgi:hypothetical protein
MSSEHPPNHSRKKIISKLIYQHDFLNGNPRKPMQKFGTAAKRKLPPN